MSVGVRTVEDESLDDEETQYDNVEYDNEQKRSSTGSIGGGGGAGKTKPPGKRRKESQSLCNTMLVDPLLTFTIPKKCKKDKALFHEISSSSPEFRNDIVSCIKNHYKDPLSSEHYVYSKARYITNDDLSKRYQDKKREMKSRKVPESNMSDSYAFISCEDEAQVRQVSESGLCVGAQTLRHLGSSKQGVYACQYSDVIMNRAMGDREATYLIILKILKGKVKHVLENFDSEPIDPTPNCDMHVSKCARDVTLTNCSRRRLYHSTQYYMYEYDVEGSLELVDRPRQIYPYAVVRCRYHNKLPLPHGTESATAPATTPTPTLVTQPSAGTTRPPAPTNHALLPSTLSTKSSTRPPTLPLSIVSTKPSSTSTTPTTLPATIPPTTASRPPTVSTAATRPSTTTARALTEHPFTATTKPSTAAPSTKPKHCTTSHKPCAAGKGDSLGHQQHKLDDIDLGWGDEYLAWCGDNTTANSMNI